MKKYMFVFSSLIFNLLILTSCDHFEDFERPLKDKSKTQEDTPVNPGETNLACEDYTYKDGGMCGGMWFVDDQGNYYEVFNYSQPGLQLGQVVSFTHEQYQDAGQNVCMAMTPFESDLYESGETIQRVSVLEVCENSPE